MGWMDGCLHGTLVPDSKSGHAVIECRESFDLQPSCVYTWCSRGKLVLGPKGAEKEA